MMYAEFTLPGTVDSMDRLENLDRASYLVRVLELG
jgi:hypothetical protein